MAICGYKLNNHYLEFLDLQLIPHRLVPYYTWLASLHILPRSGNTNEKAVAAPGQVERLETDLEKLDRLVKVSRVFLFCCNLTIIPP